MHQALIAEAIKTNANNAKEYEERKELWYRETAIAVYLDVKKKADEAEAKRKTEEAAAKKAAEEENECAMDANSEGEDEVNKDVMPKSKSKSCPIVDSESEEETKEVKAKRRKAKGKGKIVDPEYKRNAIPVDYAGCPGVPVRKRCEGCKVPANVWYQRPCMGNVIMDADDQIFSDKADFIMPEAADDEELQGKLKKLCDEQDTFRAQKEKEKAERNKLLGNSTKAGTKKKVQINAKASGSTPKGSKRKRARTVANNDGSNERIPSVAESLHGINKALIVTVNLLGDTQAANKHQAKYLHGIETCMANLQYTMQTHIAQVHNRLGELKRRAGIWPVEDKEFVDEEVEPTEPEDIEEEVEEVREEDKEGREEDKEGCEEDKEGREVENDET
ncbi:hypothetical protein M422DRAFT_271576, partial [Sphaerobolus stellatus SS14]